MFIKAFAHLDACHSQNFADECSSPKESDASSISAVDQAIVSRRSVRAFRSDPVPGVVIERILEVAARAPSGTNMQPWQVYVLGRQKISEISGAIIGSGIRPERAPWDDYRYYPRKFFEPYRARRKDLGAALYGVLGVEKGDVARMRAHFNRNFAFFDAPVGLLITIDKRLEKGSWLDLGMFIQNILICANGHGIASCPQAAFAPYHQQIRPIVNMSPQEILVCGIALGYADESRPENALHTERAPLSDWVKYL